MLRLTRALRLFAPHGLWVRSFGTNSPIYPAAWQHELLYSQRLQYPLIKEYTLNYSRNPNKI